MKKNEGKSLKQEKEKAAIEEQFRLIRASIDLTNSEQKKQVILITSPESGTGKSTIASHLAVCYAKKGERTLLIDADLRKPTIHKHFSVSRYIGLTNIITEQSSVTNCLQEVNQDGYSLSILTGGPSPLNPSELLSSKNMEQLVNQLRKIFDVIILDTPPVTMVSDALVLTDLSDGVVLTFRYHQTVKEKAQAAAEKLKLSKARLLGVIFNGTKNVKHYYY
ncbi:CpsD/CapB family tyrosine-protein kinase [Listeria aquatica]|uniref:CpsD/CapB family tyrosine-protein kinase n=1 Tax=Listeria aquatica TaxID=1494960 RepID=UPI003F71F96E